MMWSGGELFETLAHGGEGPIHMSDDSETTQELRPGHHIEFLDRVHIAEAYMEMSLGGHPMLHAYPSLKARFEQVVEQLAAMYQEVGQLEETWE